MPVTSMSSRGSRIVLVVILLFAVGGTALIFGDRSASAAVNGTYYFNGTPEDEVNKHDTMPTATFSKTAPTATMPITQTTKFFCNSDVQFNIHCANWVGPYSGDITGPMEFCSFWSSTNPADVQAGTADVELTFFDGDTQISRVTAKVNIGTPDAPAGSSAIVNVEGTVADTLGVVARPEATGQALEVHYGATSTPSFFGPPGQPCATGASPSASGSPSASPSGSPSPGNPKSPRATIRFSDLTPKRGHAVTATAGIKRCTGNQRTKIQLQRKKGKAFKKVAQKKLNKKCKATFKVATDFHKATFRSYWPKQNPAYRSGASKPQTVTTH
ncbi:MAG: hypothetical protein ABR579_08440 [Actinomycetota bacterium]